MIHRVFFHLNDRKVEPIQMNDAMLTIGSFFLSDISPFPELINFSCAAGTSSSELITKALERTANGSTCLKMSG